DLSGKTGELCFDKHVILPEPSAEVLQLMVNLNLGADIEHDGTEAENPDFNPDGSIRVQAYSRLDEDEKLFQQLIDRRNELEDAKKNTASNPTEDGMRIQVLDGIAGSDNNNAVERSYAHLLRPLPVMPAPD